tara:strand:+ start:95 stop:562 length:468 start_codon:yes stop_codon:yes gene_type:complete
METSDFISFGAFVFSGLALYFTWESHKRAKKKDSLENLINIEINWKIHLYMSNSRVETFKIPISLHNTGGRMVYIESVSISYMNESEEITMKEFSLNSSHQRVFNPGSSITFDFRHSDNSRELNWRRNVSEWNAYVKVIESNGMAFRSKSIGILE